MKTRRGWPESVILHQDDLPVLTPVESLRRVLYRRPWRVAVPFALLLGAVAGILNFVVFGG